jgi:hypothetical protein
MMRRALYIGGGLVAALGFGQTMKSKPFSKNPVEPDTTHLEQAPTDNNNVQQQEQQHDKKTENK